MTRRGWILDKLKKVEGVVYKIKNKETYNQYLKETDSKCSYKSYLKRIGEVVVQNLVKQKYPEEALEKTDPDQVHLSETIEGPNYNIVSDSSKIRTVDQLLAFCRVDLNKWKVNKQSINVWGSSKNPNFQVKIGLTEINPKELTVEQQAEQFKKLVKKYKPDYTRINNLKKFESPSMLEISLPDFHYGQLSVKEEVGNNYNTKIAEELWLNAVNYFANLAKQYKVQKILFPLGNDFFNVDNLFNTTTYGTPQDESTTWQNTFSSGWRLVTRGIDILLNVADVDLIIIPGNHDTQRTYYMGEVLKAWYQNCKKISIDNKPVSRKYYQFGKNLIGMCHGRDEKIQDLPMILTLEAKDLFSRTTFWEMQIGHFHHDKRWVMDVVDNHSVKVRIMPSIVPLSSYSKKHAYMSVREGIGLLWDKKGGKIAEFSYYPPEKLV